MSQPSPLSIRKSSSESLVESSSEEERAPKTSVSTPVMKSPNKKKIVEEQIYSSNKLSTPTLASQEKRSELILRAQKSYAQKIQLWKELSTKIKENGILELKKLTSQKFHDLLDHLSKSPNPNITRLHIGQCKIDARDVSALANAIKSNVQIVEFSMSTTEFDAAGFKAITEATIINTKSEITKFEVVNCYIGDEGGSVIAAAIQNNPNSKITEVILDSNEIGNLGAKALADAIITNPRSKITELSLVCNNISNEGGIAFFDAIKANSDSMLTKLHLSYNKISDEGIQALADAIKLNHTIISLLLNDNQFSEKSDKHIKFIQRHYELNKLQDPIEKNIAAALDTITNEPSTTDNSTSVFDVNTIIAQKLFALDRTDKLNTNKVIKNPAVVFNMYA